MDTTIRTTEEKNWGMLCHLSALAGFIIPFGNIIGPLIIWTLKRNESAFVDDQGKESLNFQITILIITLVSVLLIILAIGIFFLIVTGIVSLIFTVIASINAASGNYYRYPFNIQFVK